MVANIPKLQHLPCEEIWQTIKQDPEASRYFSTRSSKYPGKQFMLNVANV